MPNKSSKSVRRDDRRARLATAKAERERLDREKQRKRRRTWIITGSVVLVVVAVIAVGDLWVLHSAKSHDKAAAANPTAAGPSGGPPWPAPADAAAAVKAAGLPMLGAEGTALHIHAHLDVIVAGSAVTVPAEIGIDEHAQQISPLHTHDTTGVIHVESPTQSTFTLGQFFAEWGLPLSASRLGGLSVAGNTKLKAYVNGQLYSGNPATITLAAHQEITLVYGTPAQLAATKVPSSYAFPAGL